MLMICLMAVWGLNLIPHTIEDTINTTRRLPPRTHRIDGAGNHYRRPSKGLNATLLTTFPTSTISTSIPVHVAVDVITTPSTKLISPTTATNRRSTTPKTVVSTDRNENKANKKPTTNFKKVKGTTTIKKNITSPATKKSKSWHSGNNTKYITKSEHDLLPKSNMQVLQFYAQPVNPIELKAQPLTTYNSGVTTGNAVLVKPITNAVTALTHSQMYMAPPSYANTISPISSVPYKTIHDEFANGGEGLPKTIAFKPISYGPVGIERPVLNSLPILDPYNVYKRKPIVPIQPQKFVATIRPVTSSVPILPPVSVTRVYKYTEDGGPAFKLPFLDSEDSIDENLPILSAALDDRMNDRVASISIRNYMTPPKVNQPIVYGSGTHAAATLPDAYRNEFQALSKFNENLRMQTGYPTEKVKSFENDEDVDDDKENYSEEEVKKALKYIQRLKKSKPALNRGRATFKTSQQHFRTLKRKPKRKDKAEELEEDFDDVDIEPEQISSDSGKKKDKNEEQDPFHISDDDDEVEIEDTTIQVKSFSEEPDRNQEESRTKAVKADVEEKPRSLETRQAPSVNEETDEQDPFENEDLGVENDGDDRVEFQMHGLGGADSYKFGYDTGKGENRQFRYEERDANGKVKGHFGYYDRDGKLQLFNYEADPEHGYHLEKAAEH